MINKKSKKLFSQGERPPQAVVKARPTPIPPKNRKNSGSDDGGPDSELTIVTNGIGWEDKPGHKSFEQILREKRRAKLGKTAADRKGIDLDEVRREMARRQPRERITRETTKPTSDDHRASGSNRASGSTNGGGKGLGGFRADKQRQRDLPDISFAESGQSNEMDAYAP